MQSYTTDGKFFQCRRTSLPPLIPEVLRPSSNICFQARQLHMLTRQTSFCQTFPRYFCRDYVAYIFRLCFSLTTGFGLVLPCISTKPATRPCSAAALSWSWFALPDASPARSPAVSRLYIYLVLSYPGPVMVLLPFCPALSRYVLNHSLDRSSHSLMLTL